MNEVADLYSEPHHQPLVKFLIQQNHFLELSIELSKLR